MTLGPQPKSFQLIVAAAYLWSWNKFADCLYHEMISKMLTAERRLTTSSFAKSLYDRMLLPIAGDMETLEACPFFGSNRRSFIRGRLSAPLEHSMNGTLWCAVLLGKQEDRPKECLTALAREITRRNKQHDSLQFLLRLAWTWPFWNPGSCGWYTTR
jgi:hypothetical protein